MNTVNLNGFGSSRAKCPYCGYVTGLNQNDIDTLTFTCSNCHRENVLWDLRSDYMQDVAESNSATKWVFVGIVMLAISLFIILKIAAI